MFGFVMVVLIAATVRPWFSETRRAAEVKADSGGAASLANRNTVILTDSERDPRPQHVRIPRALSDIPAGDLHYSRRRTPAKSSAFLASARWPRFPAAGLATAIPRSLCSADRCFRIAVLGYLFFQVSPSMLTREILTCIYGVTGSAVLYVNLAGYHVKALRRSLSSRGSGMFVTSLYGGAAFGGYLLGWIVGRGGWLLAGEIQMSLLCLIGAVLALALRPSEMSL